MPKAMKHSQQKPREKKDLQPDDEEWKRHPAPGRKQKPIACERRLKITTREDPGILTGLTKAFGHSVRAMVSTR